LAIAYLYMVTGFTCLRSVTPDFGRLAKEEYRLEGSFRNAHHRLRSHAESVAFFGGGNREGQQLTALFSQLIRCCCLRDALASVGWATAQGSWVVRLASGWCGFFRVGGFHFLLQ
jgi:ABC-type uncharacterized transport system fused permease/ATPase subunit